VRASVVVVVPVKLTTHVLVETIQKAWKTHHLETHMKMMFFVFNRRRTQRIFCNGNKETKRCATFCVYRLIHLRLSTDPFLFIDWSICVYRLIHLCLSTDWSICVYRLTDQFVFIDWSICVYRLIHLCFDKWYDWKPLQCIHWCLCK